jgi:hypothetical protein
MKLESPVICEYVSFSPTHPSDCLHALFGPFLSSTAPHRTLLASTRTPAIEYQFSRFHFTYTGRLRTLRSFLQVITHLGSLEDVQYSSVFMDMAPLCSGIAVVRLIRRALSRGVHFLHS